MNTNATRDEVLDAFAVAASFPTASLVREWTTRYPQFADDIVELATEWAAAVLHESDDLQADEEPVVDRLMSRVQVLARQAEEQRATAPAVGASSDPVGPASTRTLESMIESGGMALDAFLRQQRIDQSVLALFDAGLVKLESVPPWFLDQVARALAWSVDALQVMLQRRPMARLALRSVGRPRQPAAMTLMEAIECSNLPADIKQWWHDRLDGR